MGKSFGGVFANWSGKVGNVVGAVRQGRTVMRIYQPQVANPRTQNQLQARGVFSLLTSTLSKFTPILKLGFRDLDGYKTGNYYSAAVGYNAKRDVVTGSYPSQQIDLTKLKIAQGSVDNPYTPQATADGTTLNITWADNTGMGNANADDEVIVAAYNADKDSIVYNNNAGTRTERNCELACPAAWTGDIVNVYLAMRRPSTGICSESMHLATLNM